MKQKITKNSFLGGTSGENRMPAIYISKYNRFVDNVLGRVNKILRKSYDPVRVRLQSPAKKTKSTKKSNKRKRNKNKRRPSGRELNNTQEIEYILVSTTVNNEEKLTTLELTTQSPVATTPLLPSSTEVTSISPKTTKNPVHNRATKRRKAAKPKDQKNKTKNTKNTVERARATLFGLSSIKRDGDVKVNIMADHTTVKTNFLIGPLTLRVEKDFGRGAKKEIKSATATTAEMHGKLNLRIVHGGAATLHSIRVLQPKQVRVDSADNHDRTREFVWKRSSHIAKVVSEKLASATRSMLRPPPKNKE